MKLKFTSDKRQVRATRRQEDGIALVITLIMLAITLVMAVAFLALARRERGSVTTSTDITTARLATDAAAANAEAQIVANILGGVINGGSSNALNMRLFVSTNYINAGGFNAAVTTVNPTNVSYFYNSGGILSGVDFDQAVANLWFLPRAPVMVGTNEPLGRFYLDLNQNGFFDPNGMQLVISDDPANPYYALDGQTPIANYTPGNVFSNFFVGDPEWVGVLEHPDAPHSANNHFVSRYAFMAVPVGNTLDVNFLHNQAITKGVNATVNGGAADGFFRNQGVGSWEINLAAFLADLNTNQWGQSVGSGATAPLGSGNYYQYNEPGTANRGVAFDDARSILSYRYNFSYFNLLPANFVLGPFLPNTPPFVFPNDRIDAYSDGPLLTTLNSNADFTISVSDGDLHPNLSWVGADNPNHYFALSDLLDVSKLSSGFVNRLKNAGNYQINGLNPTYDRYTYYRMLDELGTDSSPEDGKVNLNYANAIVTYVTNNGAGAGIPTSINMVTGAETNLARWVPLDFFHAAADQMLRQYTTDWFGSDSTNYASFTNTFAVTAPFGVTNIPVWVSNRFVYVPAVNRLLQLAANIYDASTNSFYPSVFRPIFQRNDNGDIFIVGFKAVTEVTLPNDLQDQLASPFEPSVVAFPNRPVVPIVNPNGTLINLYGVPWIIGAKKYLPNFNQFSTVNFVQVQRYLQLARASTASGQVWTNHLYLMTGNNNLGISFWNSYFNNYPTNYPGNLDLLVYVHSVVQMALTNSDWGTPFNYTFTTNFSWSPSIWPGSKWLNSPGAAPFGGSFITANWTNGFIPNEVYKTGQKIFVPPTDPDVWEVNNHSSDPLPQFGLVTTNLLQAFIVDNHHVIDYVQLRGPIETTNLNTLIQDPTYEDGSSQRYLWSPNAWGNGPLPSWGIANQIDISSTPDNPPASARWNNPPNPAIAGVDPKDAARKFLASMLDGTFQFTYSVNGKLFTYYNNQLAVQAGYTATRTMYSSTLLQANDPLVHYLGSDLNGQPGTWSFWAQALKRQNGAWLKTDDSSQIPTPPPNSVGVGGRYQPWLQPGQMDTIGGFITLTNNYAAKDPLVKHSDNWDFPTNQYPTVGWLGRVHRGTPWQTVYLKDADLTKDYTISITGVTNFVGTNTWANWVGDIQPDYYSGRYIEATRSAPVQDRLLFDVFTTRFNDNSARGTLPVNQTHLAAWSALFGGMVTLTNTTPFVSYSTPWTYTNLLINPAGVDAVNSPLWKIVNDPVSGINATRANTKFQAFVHAGDVLATPALTAQSPFINLGDPNDFRKHQKNYGISDEMYEWLPQQMMGLVRASEPRFVLYCFGQTLHPAPAGTVLNGPYFQLVTNYQVAAESAVRVVVRIEGANTSKPHAVVESYNVLPPY